jgi:hypothetical protein
MGDSTFCMRNQQLMDMVYARRRTVVTRQPDHRRDGRQDNPEQPPDRIRRLVDMKRSVARRPRFR